MIRICSGLRRSRLTPVMRLVPSRPFTLVRQNPPLYAHLASDNSVKLSVSKKENAVSVGSLPSSALADFQAGLERQQFETQHLDDSQMGSQPRISKPDVLNITPEFLPLVQEVLKKHVHNCPTFSMLALAETTSPMYFHIFDLRAPPPHGRIPEVEDILGTMRLENGKLISGSYEPNTMYRLLTQDGLLSVSDYIHDKIVDACEK